MLLDSQNNYANEYGRHRLDTHSLWRQLLWRFGANLYVALASSTMLESQNNYANESGTVWIHIRFGASLFVALASSTVCRFCFIYHA